uniref:Uncharacterized protein n=1 Tax=Tanacetum cinerariifolium TaxID=118510 RepID=A0A6L2NTB4_TANCI|nr:hypothetical protein [Tanacetum cinerariifolium]
MIVAQQSDDVADKGAVGVDVDAVPTAASEPSIPLPTPTTQPPPPSQELPSTSQVIPTPPPSPIAQSSSIPQQQQHSQPTHDAENSMDLLHTLLETCKTLTKKVEALERMHPNRGIIELIDADKDVSLENVESENDADVQGRPLESQAQMYKIDLEHADKVLSMQDDELEPTELKEVVEDDVIEQVQRKEKEDNAVLRYQALKRKPQIGAQARKNMMIYLWNVAGFKMDYFKGMSYDDIHPIFEKYFNSNLAFLEKTKEQMEKEDNKALKRKTESSEKKAVKKQKLDEERTANYYKIIRAGESHKLFLSFLSLLRNFDREDLEVLWQIVKERFASSKPKNFSDDFLLTTFTYMFEKPDVQAQVWKNQRSVHGLANVKSWRLLESPLELMLMKTSKIYAKGLLLLVEDLLLLIQVDAVERCC